MNDDIHLRLGQKFVEEVQHTLDNFLEDSLTAEDKLIVIGSFRRAISRCVKDDSDRLDAVMLLERDQII